MSTPDFDVRNDTDHQAALRTLAARSRPNWTLRLLMRGLERYRQSKKLGWSRAQNKVGLTTFAAFELDRARDTDVFDLATTTFAREFAGNLSSEDAAFVTDLRQDRGLMGFVFVHDLRVEGRAWEGVTFSLGRRAVGESRHRDRFDVIVESELREGTSAGLSRIRAYVDPFRRPIERHPARAFETTSPSAAGQALFDFAKTLYAAWAPNADRHWQHWTSDYIDYFGPRATPVAGTHFPTHVDGFRAAV